MLYPNVTNSLAIPYSPTRPRPIEHKPLAPDLLLDNHPESSEGLSSGIVTTARQRAGRLAVVYSNYNERKFLQHVPVCHMHLSNTTDLFNHTSNVDGFIQFCAGTTALSEDAIDAALLNDGLVIDLGDNNRIYFDMTSINGATITEIATRRDDKIIGSTRLIKNEVSPFARLAWGQLDETERSQLAGELSQVATTTGREAFRNGDFAAGIAHSLDQAFRYVESLGKTYASMLIDETFHTFLADVFGSLEKIGGSRLVADPIEHVGSLCLPKLLNVEVARETLLGIIPGLKEELTTASGKRRLQLGTQIYLCEVIGR